MSGCKAAVATATSRTEVASLQPQPPAGWAPRAQEPPEHSRLAAIAVGATTHGNGGHVHQPGWSSARCPHCQAALSTATYDSELSAEQSSTAINLWQV
mgnify:CR=1 FL=1